VTAAVEPRRLVVPRQSSAGRADHPGRQHRRHPIQGRDMRDVPIPPAPGPPPPGRMGTRLCWAPWSQEWQVFCAPCPVCDEVLPIAFPARVCVRCVQVVPGFDAPSA
jgi:hypothetical protein